MNTRTNRARGVPTSREFGFQPGETLNKRCARLDGELTLVRADIGARGEPTDCQRTPQLDDRLPGLLLDALAPIEAAIASAGTGVPYAAMRSAMEVDEIGRRKVLSATKAVIAEHPQFFAEHHSAFEFIVPFMAITAAQVDQLLKHTAAQHAESEKASQPCSWREAVIISALVLGPVLLLAGFAIYKLLKKG